MGASRPSLTYADFCRWKKDHGLRAFDWALLFPERAREGRVETLYERL